MQPRAATHNFKRGARLLTLGEAQASRPSHAEEEPVTSRTSSGM